LKGKSKPTETKSATTKGQLAKWQKEQRRRRFLHIGIIIAIVAVVGIIVYGIYDAKIKPWRQPIVKVNGQVLNMNDYVQFLRVQGVDSNTDVETARDYVDVMVDCELMRQAAKEYGIYPQVTDEVDDQLEKLKQSYQEAEQDFQQQLKELKITEADLKRWWIEPQVLTAKLADFISSDPDDEGLEEYYIPKEAEQVELFGILVGTEEEANSVIGELNNNEEFSLLAREYSQDEWSKREIYLRGILVANQNDAEEMKTKLISGEDDFDTLVANSLDEDSKGRNGDLGWLTYNDLEEKFGEGDCDKILDIDPDSDNPYDIVVDEDNYWVVQALEKKPAGSLGWMPEDYIKIAYGEALAEAAFKLGKGNFSQKPVPAKEESSYWVIKVDSQEERPISGQIRSELKQDAIERWTEDENGRSEIENYVDESKVKWALGAI
jgi:hypothetical protein